MIESLGYRNAFIAAIALHVLIAIMLLVESTSSRPVLMASTKTETNVAQMAMNEPQQQAIKAVSVDSQDVMNTVNRLKQERLQKQHAEEKRQKTLSQQAESARLRRVEEQHHLEALKAEASKLAITHQKQMAEEQRHLKELAHQNALQEKQLEAMKTQQIEIKKQQTQEKNKLAELQKNKATELARINQAKEVKAKEDLAQKQHAAAVAEAAMNAENNARMAGEVDKYKALIIGAISRQWILPENINNGLSSQFRIRLAPNGIVLDVNLTRSSGDPILDRSAQSAIYKASPLPVPSDPAAFNVFRDISLTVRPESARG